MQSSPYPHRAGSRSGHPPQAVIWSLTNHRTGELILSIPVMPGHPGMTAAAARLSAIRQARRHAAKGEKVLVSDGERQYLYDRKGYRVPCSGCKRWAVPHAKGKPAYCGHCRQLRAAAAQKRKAAREEAARKQLALPLAEEQAAR